MSLRRAAGSLWRVAAAAGLALLALAPHQGWSQGPRATEALPVTASGMITARSFAAPAAGFSVSVAPYDDSELNLRLKEDFERRLVERWQTHLTAEPAAAFLLLFESEVVSADMAPPPPSLGSARIDEQGAEVQVNVWSSSRDSLFGGRNGNAEGGSNVFHISALLRDRQSGELAWQGDAYYVLSEPNPERVARALVPPLVDRIGRSIVREPLEID